MTCRFPNPVPSGTRVPQWALIDVTVRCYVFFTGNIFTPPSTCSLGTIGTQTSHLQLVVRTLSLSLYLYLSLVINVSHSRPVLYLDSPEQAPGVLLGPSVATAAASRTRSVGTSTFIGEPSSSSTVKPASPVSPSTSKSSSNTGAIVGGVVGGVAVISAAAIAIVFFLRRRNPASPIHIAPGAPPGFGAAQPHMDEIHQPLTINDGHTSSTVSVPGAPGAPMRIYVRVSFPITRRASMFAHRIPFLTSLTLRTRMIQPRSLGIKKFRKRQTLHRD